MVGGNVNNKFIIATEKNSRHSNIELLRILCGLNVIILHYANREIGGGLEYVIEGSANYYILSYLTSLLCCSVNIFILISGYFLSSKKEINLIRVFQLFIEVIFINMGSYFLDVICGERKFVFHNFINAILPDNYFLILYCTLFILSPYLNIIIKELKKREFNRLVIILFFLFSFWEISVDILEIVKGSSIVGLSTIGIWGNQEGYTIINFIMLYMIGAYIHLVNVNEINIKKIFCILVLNSIGITIWSRVDEATAWAYCNPLVILEGVLIFIIFLRINIGYSKIINSLAKEVFSVFLLHTFFIDKIGIKTAVNYNFGWMMIHLILSTLGIYTICYLGGRIYSFITRPLFKNKKLVWGIDREID